MTNAERQTPNAERRTPNAERRTPNAKRQTPNAKRQTPNAKRQAPYYMRDGALAKDTIPKGIPTWNLSLGIHGMDRRFPEATFTMLNDCYELG